MRRQLRVPVIGALGALTLSMACATTTASARPDDALPCVPNSPTCPSGVMTSCAIVERSADALGRKVLIIAGMKGAFSLALPAADDWRFQCDAERFFWGLSASSRMQVSVTPYRPQPDEDVTPRNYLANIGANLKRGLEARGLRVTKQTVSALPTAQSGDSVILEQTIDAPAGQAFPQDTFFSAWQGPGGVMLDVHFTTYPRDAAEQATLRATVRVMSGSVMVREAPPVTGSTKPEAEPQPSLPGVSVDTFSNQTLAAMKVALGCQGDTRARTCAALDRFAEATSLPPTANGVWAGSVLWAFAGADGRVARAGEGLHHLYVRGGRASFNVIKPSTEAEAREAQAALARVHDGQPPARDTGVMQYIATFTPLEANPVEVRAGSLSFTMGMGLARVFVRENPKELLVVELWGGGAGMKIGIFPKG